MTEALIRRMRAADLAHVGEILACWNMAPIAPSASVPEPERSAIDVPRTFVAEAAGRLIGVASYLLRAGGEAETASLAVDPAWRGAGVGERLQEARLAELESLGVATVRTECDRPEVVAWYVRKYGYRVVGTKAKKHPFSLPDVDRWTVLELDLRAWARTRIAPRRS